MFVLGFNLSWCLLPLNGYVLHLKYAKKKSCSDTQYVVGKKIRGYCRNHKSVFESKLHMEII